MRQRTSNEFRMEEAIDGIGLLAGGANVIMQLSWLPVGHGVVESKVDSGNLYLHPIKRARTTLTYLAVAALGSEQERMALRRDVNRSHARVRSDADSRIGYNAFDPELQLWVAACIYQGFVDTHTKFSDRLEGEHADAFYAEAARFGTTLQVPAEMWPADRDAFARYWDGAVERIKMDRASREYLQDFASLGFLPRPVRLLFGRLHRFVTTGFLPQEFRAELRLPWGARSDLVFGALIRALGLVNRRLPPAVRVFPFTVLLADARRRIAAGRPIV